LTYGRPRHRTGAMRLFTKCLEGACSEVRLKACAKSIEVAIVTSVS
jgi:hypothetical protein